jgi:hypothetical protein
MNPIAGDASPQQEPKTIQDVAPPPSQTTPQPTRGVNDGPMQAEIVSDLPVKVQEAPPVQTQKEKGNPITGNRSAGSTPAGQDDKELDKVLKDVNKQIKKDDNKPPKIGIFKRWESVFVIVIALIITAALCLAAVSAFKTK